MIYLNSKNSLAITFFSGIGIVNISILMMNILFLILSIYNLKRRIKNMKIAIIGPGAVGKTTIIKYLEQDLKEFEFIYERTNLINEDFEKYMEDMQSNAFEMQKNFFYYRKEEVQKLNNFKNVIIDRHLIDDFIFPQVHIESGNFTEQQVIDWKKIEKKYLNFLESTPKLDFVFLLEGNNEEIKKRRVNRSQNEKIREFELNNHTFFEKVNEKYKSPEFILSISKYSKKCIILENNDSKETAEKIKQIILKNI